MSINITLCTSYNKRIASDFLISLDKEFDFSRFPGGILGTIDLLLNRGTIVIWRNNNEVICLLGYFLGEPSNHFNNISTAYIYLLVIHPKHRKKFSLVKSVLRRTTRELKSNNITNIHFKALQEDEYLNKLYSKLAIRVGVEPNAEGRLCNLYSTNIDNWISRFL